MRERIMGSLMLLIVMFLSTSGFAGNSDAEGHHHQTEIHNHADGDHHHKEEHVEEEQYIFFNKKSVLLPSHVHDHGASSMESFSGILTGTFRYAVMVSLFVLVMMLAIEYVTILSQGKWNKIFSEKGWVQILFAAVLGIIPGCLGTYVAVSLYIHKVIGFAALVTVMIATSGDEAFIMIKEMPLEALTIMVVLFVVAIIAGLVIHMFMKNRTLMVLDVNHMRIHPTEDDCKCFDSKNFLSQFQKISFERALLVFFGFLFLISLLTGSFGFHEWDWERTVFLIVTLIGLFIVITVPDHFLSKHLWGHVIKKHFLKIFLWTFGAFFAIAVMNLYFDVASILQGNLFYVMVIAVLIGILPESGPHIVFIALFLQGHIPISILIANSIVQDGHGALPLLAESRRSFVAVKLINMVFGFLAGLAGYYFGF